MYVLRDSEGKIIGMFANLQPGIAEEYLKENSKELLAAIEAFKKIVEV